MKKVVFGSWFLVLGSWFLVLGSWKVLIPKHQALSSFFIPQISLKILTCPLVLVPDETKIKGRKGRKGQKEQGGSRFGHREGSISVTFEFTH